MKAIPLTNAGNFQTAAAMAGISAEELMQKMFDAQQETKKKNQKEWVLDFLDKDEVWWDETLQKVEEIRASLPKDLDYKKKTIRLYGWIAESLGRQFDIPMEPDRKYADASGIKLLLTDLDAYHRIMNWN